jgi:hypothetical protein
VVSRPLPAAPLRYLAVVPSHQTITRGAARCAPQVFVRGAQAAARGAVQVLDCGAQASARSAVPRVSQVLDRGAQAVARGAARCTPL